MKCACCGKNVRKYTVTVYVEKEKTGYHTGGSGRYFYYGANEPPRTIADCQRLTNQKVVSIDRHDRYDEYGAHLGKGHVRLWNEWDGEHYLPSYGYFCSNTCAGHYAQAVVRELRKRKQPSTPERSLTK